MDAGQGLWNLCAILHYLERGSSSDPNMLKLLGLGQESCRALSRHIKVDQPSGTELTRYIEHFQHEFKLPAPDIGSLKHDEPMKEEKGGSSDPEAALVLCRDILARVEFLDSEAAEDFRESLTEKVQSMQEWIEKEAHVTEKMMAALENMSNGVSKWESRKERDPW